MNATVFSGNFSSAVDQYTFDQIPGAEAALQSHWQTYITEDTIAAIAATGINALRIPIGFWAYNNTNTPYIQGADQYLQLAIGWARNYGMKVWVVSSTSPCLRRFLTFSLYGEELEACQNLTSLGFVFLLATGLMKNRTATGVLVHKTPSKTPAKQVLIRGSKMETSTSPFPS
jgi:hypothetical protein